VSKKIAGIALIALGMLLLGVSAAADVLGLGTRAGFGWLQLLGTIVGLGVALIGFWLTRRKG
jgi:hypothetical protein